MPKTRTKAASPAPIVKRKRRSPEEIMNRLMQAAKEEFEQFGYTGATTAAIARRADITETQLFRYFKSKADLFREAVYKPLNHSLLEFSNTYLSKVAGMENREERIRLYITELQGFVDAHSELLMALVVAQSYEQKNKHMEELDSLHTCFKLGADMLASRMDKTPKISSRLMTKISFATVLSCITFKEWLFFDDPESEEEIVTAIGDFLINGVYANFSQDPDDP